MTQTFKLPAVGDTMVEAEIVEWLVDVGDEVTLDQPICSIETDKSVVEMTTPFRGVVLELGGEPGDILEVGEPLIVVGEVDDVGEGSGTAAPFGTTPPETKSPGATPSTPKPHNVDNTVTDLNAASAASESFGSSPPAESQGAVAGPGALPAPPSDQERRRHAEASDARRAIYAMPHVRKRARERLIDLATVVGTGPRGIITLPDVEAASQPGEGRRERLSATRRAIIEHLSESVQRIPQFTAMVEVNAAPLMAARAAIAERIGGRVPLDAVLAAILVPVLQDHPIMNATLDGNEIVYYNRYDIGIAVDTSVGLVVPVVRDVDKRCVADIAAEVLRLSATARNRTIRPQELAGSTATVNNVGPVGLLAGTPILPLGTSMLAAFGEARPTLRLVDGQPVEVPTMIVSATFDHRLIDGGSAGRFLAQLRTHLESADPTNLR